MNKFKMSQLWKYGALFVSFAVLLNACSSSYNPGQKVWIDLPHQGFAIAKVIRVRDNKARLRVIKIHAAKSGKLVKLLKRKRVVVATSLLKPVKAGRSAWKARIAAIRASRLENLLAMMSGKSSYKGKTKYNNKTLNFEIKFTKYNDKNGEFTGRITWPQRKKAVHRIQGQVNKKKLSMQFKSVAVIKRGNWKLGNKFKFSMAGSGGLKGTVTYKVLFFPVKKRATIAFK